MDLKNFLDIVVYRLIIHHVASALYQRLRKSYALTVQFLNDINVQLLNMINYEK